MITAPGRKRFDCRDDRGQVAGIEAIPFGLLLFAIGSLMIANAWAVIDTKMAVAAVAREAARAYVESPDHASGMAAVTGMSADVIRDYGRDPDKLALPPPTADGDPDGQPFERCVRVTFTASYPVPAISLPLAGGFGTGFTVKASYSEVIDPYRNSVGTSGREARCG